MELPKLNAITRKRESINSFGGYNHTISCEENEFYEAENLSTRNYPALSPRLPRVKTNTFANCEGLFFKNGIIWVENQVLYYNAVVIGEVSAGEKTFCGMGSKVLIWPDKLAFDTVELTLKPLGAKWQSVGSVHFAPSLEDGSDYAVKSTGDTAPENPQNGDFWLDTSSTTATLRVYSQSQELWSAVPTTFIKISAKGIGANFALYDTVNVIGVSEQICEQAGAHLNGDLILWDVGEDYLVVTALLGASLIQEIDAGEIIVERKIPDLDFIVQSDNRIWGCSSAEHTIYACKLGDATNWFSYMGTAADSYAVNVGSDGDFTGAEVVLGYVLFFKENLIHKVYGTKPANFQVTTISCYGVQAGSEKSLVIVHDTLYYLSPSGVVAYDGGLPVYVGEGLGEEQLFNGIAGVLGDNYYLACQSSTGKAQLFVYDTKRRIWQKESTDDVRFFANITEGLYMLMQNGELWYTPKVGSVPLVGNAEFQVIWSAQSGIIGLYAPDYKIVSKIELRVSGEIGARLKIEAQYDNQNTWDCLAKHTLTNGQMIILPIIPRRYAQMKLRISGMGDVTLYSLTKLLEQGSELSWQI